MEDADEVTNMGRIWTMISSPNNQIPHIICGDKCGYIWVIDRDNLTIKNIFECHEDQIITLAFSPITDDLRSSLLATGSWDKVVKLINPFTEYTTIAEFKDHEAAIIHVDFWYFNDELYLISFDCAGTIILRNISRSLQVGPPLIKNY